MNYSIFHTSHCGSTLLAALLSQSLPTITEPRWSHQIKNHKSKEDIKKHIESNLIDGQLTKYSSAYTHVAPLVSGKKVFVYRKLNHHLQKMVSNPEYLHNNLNYIEDCGKDYIHPKLKESKWGKFKSDLEKQAYYWVQRYFYMKDERDIIFVDTNELFENPNRECEQICDFFGIKYNPININFNVKKARLNHNDYPIRLDNKMMRNIVPENPKNHIMKDSDDKEIVYLCKKAVKHLFKYFL